MTLTEKADQLAARAHEGQTRKGSNEPYITHPRAVAAILKAQGFGESVIAAALVHDVVEDTKTTLEDVRRELGEEVARLVELVTHDDTLSWEEKKQKYIDTVRTASAEVKAIAVADKIHNTQSFIAGYGIQGEKMWEYFSRSREKKLWFEEVMLTVLRETWEHPLVDEYAALVERMKALD